MLEARADPDHPDHAEICEWLDGYDPDELDVFPIEVASAASPPAATRQQSASSNPPTTDERRRGLHRMATFFATVDLVNALEGQEDTNGLIEWQSR